MTRIVIGRKYSHQINGKHIRFVKVEGISGDMVTVVALNGKIANYSTGYDVTVADLVSDEINEEDEMDIETPAEEQKIESSIELPSALVEHLGERDAFASDGEEAELKALEGAETRKKGRGSVAILKGSREALESILDYCFSLDGLIDSGAVTASEIGISRKALRAAYEQRVRWPEVSVGESVPTAPEPVVIPANWLFMAENAITESARSFWRKKCASTG